MRFWAWAESMPADYGDAAPSGKTRVAAGYAFPALVRSHGRALHPDMARNDRPFPPEILYLAKRYLWWQPLEVTLQRPLRLVAAIMDEGTAGEWALVRSFFGLAQMRRAVKQAAYGWFRPASWSLWHHRLKLIPDDVEPPAPPARVGSGPRGGRPRRQAAAERRALSTSSIAT